MIVKERVVKRWYAPRMDSDGKTVYTGYGSKLAAYKAAAKQMLYDEVFGPMQEVVEPNGGYPYRHWVRPGVAEVFGERDKFAKKMREFGFQCDEFSDWEGEPCSCCTEGFGFCGKKYKKWINDRAKELMDWATAKVPATDHEHPPTANAGEFPDIENEHAPPVKSEEGRVEE